MAPNDLIALKANYDRWLATRGAGISGVNPFNYYCVENFLKAFPVEDKEIRTGLVDQSKDGGVDGFYFFANRKYVFEDSVLDGDSEYKVNLVIFQCKEGSGFSPVEVGKFVFFTEDLLDLSRGESSYKAVYHQRLKALMKVFKDQCKTIAGAVTEWNIDFIYISKLDIDEPRSDSDVQVAADRVKAEAKKHFSKASTAIDFVNAAKLYAQASVRKSSSRELTYSSQTIQSDEGWIGLVELRALYRFLQDEHGQFQESMLEENVRGYQSKTVVNDGIEKTLKEQDKSVEFWLLNNGITILAEKLTPLGMKSVTIKDPQIVNGLQTSRNIFDYYKVENGGRTGTTDVSWSVS